MQMITVNRFSVKSCSPSGRREIVERVTGDRMTTGIGMSVSARCAEGICDVIHGLAANRELMLSDPQLQFEEQLALQREGKPVPLPKIQ